MAKEDVNGSMDDPIVVVGMSCRFPGDATSPEAFWKMVSEARSAHGKVPNNRFNADAYYHPNPDRQGAIYTKSGHFMSQDPAVFDAPFFSMTAIEAAALDPQQRMLLELVYEGFENAGMPMAGLPKSNTSVYVGCFSGDYESVSGRDIYNLNPYEVTGIGKAMLSNRISWFFDLRGASLTLDTACSSSLYGVHLACQSLLLGETNAAVCCGSTLMLQPDLFRALSAMRFMSSDGICHSFDSRANGYARGEGLSVVVLKRLSTAIADGDTIRAVIRATGLNQDGRTPGITMPSATAQADLIQSCYQKAGLSYDETAYFEAHGTGTQLGDPLELSAVGATIGKHRDPAQPLYVSSAKTNIGHQEGGAGLAGLIRAVLALEKGLIPPLAGFEEANPKLKLDEWGVALPTSVQPWPRSGLRRASLNSFGYGGANAHAILDDAYHYLSSRSIDAKHVTYVDDDELAEGSDSGFSSSCSLDTLALSSSGNLDTPGLNGAPKAAKYQIFPYSGADHSALERLFVSHAKYLQDRVNSSMKSDSRESNDLAILSNDLAFTLAGRRSLLDRRSFVVADGIPSLLAQMQTTAPNSRKASKKDGIFFVFTGQGAQYCQQGQELLQYPAVKRSLEAAQRTLVEAGCTWDLIQEMLKPASESRINSPEFSQPLCTALQLAQVDLLDSWGITPKAVVGHSSGEIAAAYAYGAISHQDAMIIAYHRGVLSAAVNERRPDISGCMMAVALAPDAVEVYLQEVEPLAVVVACVNSPESVTLSGNAKEIDKLEKRLTADGVFARKLKVQTAYHSHHMEVIADDYLNAISSIKVLEAKANVRMFSSVTSAIVSPAELGPSYWVANMLQPVQFSAAMHALLSYTGGSKSRRKISAPYVAAVELGPHGALKGPIQQIWGAADKRMIDGLEYCSVMSRGRHAVETTLEAVGRLWSLGCAIDLCLVNHSETPLKALTGLTDLPPYPWNHTKAFWHESFEEKERRQPSEPRNDLLGAPAPHFDPLEPRWRNMLRMSENPWLQDHMVQDTVVLPGAAMLVSALEAAKRLAERERPVKGFRFRDVQFMRGLVIPPPPQKIDVALRVAPRRLGTRADSSAWFEFSYCSYPDEAIWQTHCRGLFAIEYEGKANEVDAGKEATMEWEHTKTTYEQLRRDLTSTLGHEAFYAYTASRGYQYGPRFQGVQECAYNDQGAWAGSVAIPNTKATMPYEYEFDHLIHPSTLDSIFQLPLGSMIESENSQDAFVPVAVDELYISASLPKGAGSRLVALGRSEPVAYREARSHITVSDEELSEPKIVVTGFRFAGLQSLSDMASTAPPPKKSLELRWTPRVFHVGPTLQPLDTRDPEAMESAQTRLHLRTVRKSVQALSLVDPSKLRPHVQAAVRLAKSLETVPKPLEAQTSALLPDNALPESPAFDKFPECLVALIEEGKDPAEALSLDLVTSLDTVCSKQLSTATSRLASWLESVHVEKPNISVLFVGDGRASCALELGKIYDGQFKRCVLTEPTPEALLQSKALLKSHGRDHNAIELEELEVLGSKLPANLEMHDFDLIIASPITSPKAIATLRSLLRDDGRLVLCGLKHADSPDAFFRAMSLSWSDTSLPATNERSVTESVQMALDQSGFEQISTSETSDTLLVTGLAADACKADESAEEVVFLTWPETPDDVAALAAGIQKRLASDGRSITFARMDESDKLIGKTIVSFMELSRDFLAEMTESDFELFKNTVGRAHRILWLTRGAQPVGQIDPTKALATGLLRCLGAENEQMLPIHVDLSLEADLQSSHIQDRVAELVRTTLVPENMTMEREYAEKDGDIFVPRVLFDDSIENELQLPFARPMPKAEPLMQPGRALKLVVGTPGQLDSIHWVDDAEFDQPLGADDVEFESCAMGLNFLDLMAVLGKIKTDKVGFEVAGTVTRVGCNVTRFSPGQQVVGLKEGGFHTHTRKNQRYIQELPAGLTPAVAASLPTIYMTAYAGLVQSARLRKGETVLIHAAAGGVGQAAIQISQWIGAEIFVTVGSNEKKELLMKHYGLPEDHIFSSRDASFAAGVKRVTQGRGVDVILNSLAGELLRQTWECIADFGRFVEVGKRDIIDNSGLEMAPFLRNTTFSAFNMEHLDAANPQAFTSLFQEVFDLVRSGAVGPVQPTKEYTFNDLEKALRSMQAGQHMGKLVVKVDRADMVPVMPRPREEFKLDPQATYVLCGGLGGIGRSISRIMFEHGAGHIVFISRSGASTDEAKEFMKSMKAEGWRLDAFACDTSDPAAVKAFVHDCQARGWRIRGFIQCAMALRNRALAMMSFEDWTITIKSKVDSTKNLHDALPKELDFFIMLASTSGILGAPSQGNYAAGNTYQDAFAHWRRSQGLSGTSLDFGVVSDVGYIAENGGVKNFDHFTGFEELHISESDIHIIISAALMGKTADDRPYPAQSIVGIGTSLLENSVLGVPFQRNPKFAHLKSGKGKADTVAVSDLLRSAIADSASVSEAAGYVLEALTYKMAKMVGIAPDDVDTSRPLHTYGVDSLVAVEIRNWFFRELKSEVALFDLLAPLPLTTLALKVASKSKLVSAEALKADMEQVKREVESSTSQATG